MIYRNLDYLPLSTQGHFVYTPDFHLCLYLKYIHSSEKFHVLCLYLKYVRSSKNAHKIIEVFVFIKALDIFS